MEVPHIYILLVTGQMFLWGNQREMPLAKCLNIAMPLGLVEHGYLKGERYRFNLPLHETSKPI